MAYNKNNYENNRLTPKQEKFVQEIAKGKTQYEAYITAYPKAKKWTRNAIDVAAAQLMQHNKILIRLKELNAKQEKKVEWTRDRALKTINYAMEMNQKDMERINEAYEEQLNIKEQELQQWVQCLSVENIDVTKVQTNIRRVMNEINDLKKIRRTNSVNTRRNIRRSKTIK